MSSSSLGILSCKEYDIHTVLKDFECGDQSLNAFLHQDSKKFNAALFCSMWAVIHETHGPVGFFTLSTTSLRIQPQEKAELKLESPLDRLLAPAVLLGRLAVSDKLQGKGLGRQIVDFIKAIAVESAELVSSRLLIVDSFIGKEPFYERCGFKYCTKGGKRSPSSTKMFFDLIDLYRERHAEKIAQKQYSDLLQRFF